MFEQLAAVVAMLPFSSGLWGVQSSKASIKEGLLTVGRIFLLPRQPGDHRRI